jgi:hypothetical protein
MAMMAPKTLQHLSFDALFDLLRTGFADIAEHRPGKPDIALTDALMSAFAWFSLKLPSLLAFDKERTEGNVQRVYGIEQVPCDTVMREILLRSSPRPSVHCSRASFEPSSVIKYLRRWSLWKVTPSELSMGRAIFPPTRFTARRVEKRLTALAPSLLVTRCWAPRSFTPISAQSFR